MKKYNTLISLAVIVAYTAVSAATVFSKPKAMSETENRELAQAPSFSLEALLNGNFTDEFEAYTTDQFKWRDAAISLRANCEYLLGKKGNNGVHFAKDGYLIARPEKCNEENLEKNLNGIIALADTELVNVCTAVVPTAFETLKDKLPSHSYDSRVADVNSYINQKLGDTGVSVCDFTDVLQQHKDDYIYYRTDHHMTSEGCYYLYSKLGEALGYEPYPIEDFSREELSDEFKGTSWSKAAVTFAKKDTIEKFVLPGSTDQTLEYPLEGIELDSIYDESFLETKDKYSTFLGGNHALTVIKSNCDSDRKLAVIKDSYAHAVAPFLANHFESVHLVDLRYYNEDLLRYLDDNDITDVLVLYNAETFNTDTSLPKLEENTYNSSVFDPPAFGFLDVTEPVTDDYFADAVIFGDSIAAGFIYAATIPGIFVSKASTNTVNIHTEKIGDRTLVESLLSQEASKYYIELGINEVSYRPPEEYKENMRNLISMIREKNPSGIIYLQSLMPIAYSTELETSISKAKIDAYNEILVALAEEENCYYLNVNGYLAEENGYLQEGVASDGIHFGVPYYRKWEDYLRVHAVQDKRRGKTVTVAKPYAGGGEINLDSFAQEMVDCVLFEDELSPVTESAAARMFNLSDGEVLNGVVYAGSGGKADEFAAFEVQSPEKAEEIADKMRARIESRKQDFENYIPEEMPKLNNPVVVVDGNLVVMCVSADGEAAKVVISHY